MVLLLGVILASALATWAAMHYSRRQGLIDQPGARRSHDRPIARAGGLGPVLILVFFCFGMAAASASGPADAWVLSVFLIASATLILAGLGFWDDHRSLSPQLRLAVQALVCSCLVIGLMLVLAPLPTVSSTLLWGLVTIILAMGIINAFNFMDGSHGMAVTQALFVSLVVGGLLTLDGEPMAWIALVLASCMLGFLPFNFPQPRVFMGDVGSMGMGTALLGLLLYAWMVGVLSWWELILLMQVFLVDTGLTLLDRIRRGQQWYTSHRDHAYQRLLRRGWSHAQVMVLYLMMNLLITLPGLWLTQTGRVPVIGVVAGSLFILGGGWNMVNIKTTSAKR